MWAPSLSNFSNEILSRSCIRSREEGLMKIQKVPERDAFTYACPVCGKTGELSGDVVNIAKNLGGVVELNCGHTAEIDD